jgi:hypothetical protein
MRAASVVVMQTGLTRIACLLAGFHGKKDAGGYACGTDAWHPAHSKRGS